MLIGIEVRLLHNHQHHHLRLKDGDAIFLDDYTSKGSFYVFEKDILGYKTRERLEEDLHLQGAEKEFTSFLM